jgi:formimidoylglutamate deiminase
MKTLYRPELLYSDGRFVAGGEVLVSEDGRVVEARDNVAGVDVVELPGKALLPGFVNAHSHTFQRLIRGKSESRVMSGRDFWSWRGTMYHAASRLDPEQVYDVARMAFLEMVMAGTTTVGEFHYLHNAPGGRPYDDPNVLSKQVIAAAQSVGIRIVLLRTAYLRSGFELPQECGGSYGRGRDVCGCGSLWRCAA